MNKITDFDKDIRLLRRRIDRLENQENLIAFYGSSTIRLWVRMKEDLDPLNVINLGFGGSNFDACIYYFDHVFHGLHPEQIVLYGGDNDLALDYDAQTISDRFTSLTEIIRSKYPYCYLYGITIKPSPHREDKLKTIRQANHLIKQTVKQIGNASLIDTFTPLINTDGTPRPELYMADGLHLNQQGYKLWAEAVRKIVH